MVFLIGLDLENRHGLAQMLCFPIQGRCPGGGFFHHGGILLCGLVQSAHRSADVVDALQLVVGRPANGLDRL